MALSNHRLCESILVLSLIVIAAYPFIDPDGWWHLRTGQHILETHTIPSEDPFSGTAAGAGWVAHEWLAEILMYLLYQLGGFALLTVTFSCIAAGAFWIAYRRSEGKPFVAALATMLGAAAAVPVFGVRPQIISLLFVSVFLTLLHPDRATGGASGRIWWLVPLTLLWANLHGAFTFGIALVGLRIVGLMLDRWILVDTARPVWPEIRRLFAVLGGCLLVVPINPNGLKLYVYPFETMFRQTERLFIQEWQSPNFHLPMFQFFAGLALLVFVLLGLSGKRPRPSTVLLLLATFYASLQAGRHIPIFALAAVPPLAEHLSHTVSHSANLSRLFAPSPAVTPARAWINRAFLLLMVVLVVAQIGDRIRQQPDREAERFPKDAVQFLSENGVDGTIFNTYDWGGYLIWHLYPKAKPYIDGRPEIYGDPYVQEFMAAYGAGVNWRNVLDHSDIRTVLVRPDTAIANILAEQPVWEQRFENDVAVVFTRR